MLAAQKTIVALSIGTETIRIALAKVGPQKVEVQKLRTLAVAGLDEEAQAQLLKEALGGIRNAAVGVLVIETPSVITKNIEIPSVNETEIREIIELQAGRYTPYAREEIIVEHMNLATFHNSYTKVLVIIVLRKLINAQITLMTRAGISLGVVMFAADALGAVCARVMHLSEKEAPRILLNLEEKNSDFVVVEKSKAIFVRSIPIGYAAYTADPKGCTVQFLEEAKKTLEAYRLEDLSGMPDEVVVIGSQTMADALKAELATALGMLTKAVSFYSGFSLNPDLLMQLKEVSFVSTLAAVGAFGQTYIDLRPSDLKLKAAFKERSREIIKSGILVVCITVLLCALLLIKIYYRGVYLQRIGQELSRIEPQVSQLEKSLHKNTIIKSFLTNRNRSLEVMTRLYEFVPESIYLKAATIDQNGQLVLKGTADAMSEVFSFVTMLENSGYFQNVKAQNTSSRKEGTRDVSDFEITAGIRGKYQPPPEPAGEEKVKDGT